MSSVKYNFFYNYILTVGNYIFPLLTYPYVSRVLGVSNIGICNYVDSIINYFVMFSALGIGSLGVREIAKVKDDQDKMSSLFSVLFIINISLTLFAVVFLLLGTLFISLLEVYKPFLYVGVMKLVMSAFMIEWFYQGNSLFKYVTIRSLIVRSIYVLCVFLFVNSESDVLLYYFLSCLMVAANASFNWIYSQKFVKLSCKCSSIKYYIMPIISYGLYRILASMYTSFNVAYLGSVTDATQVGYFTTATKLYTILMGTFTAFTTVMVPRVSELFGKGDCERLKIIANKTFEVIFSLTIPTIIICCCYSSFIIHLIAGNGYEGAVIPFRIVMLLLLVIALEQIIIQQFLMAVKDSKCIVILSGVGAFLSVICNLVLVERYECIGSAFTWVISEISILLVSLYYFKKHFNMTFPIKRLLKYFVAYLPLIIICYCCQEDNITLKTGCSFVFIFFWFYLVNIRILRNDFLISLFSKIRII